MRTRTISAICFALLVGAWAVDLVSPQLFVAAILLSAPIALSSVALNRRLTLVLIALALAADASAGWYNAFKDAYRWEPIAVGDRLLAGMSILLVGVLTMKAQQAALHAGELLERQAKSEVLRDLIYALSHDLRTPLAATGMTMRQALAGAYGRLPEAYREILARSIASNEELCRLAETLLLVARYESGEQSQMRAPVDLAVLLRSVVAQLQPLWESRYIRLSLEMTSPAPQVLGDDVELRRAVTNLLANAVTWTPDGGEIGVRLLNSRARAHIIVEDNGFGVPAGVREKLFVRFAGRTRGSGSGLGLYIVRRIAEGHGGEVSYEPGRSAGSTFTLTLPLLAQTAPHV